MRSETSIVDGSDPSYNLQKKGGSDTIVRSRLFDSLGQKPDLASHFSGFHFSLFQIFA